MVGIHYSEDLRLISDSARVYYGYVENRVDFRSIIFSRELDRILRLQLKDPESSKLPVLVEEYNGLKIPSGVMLRVAVSIIQEYLLKEWIDRDFVIYHGELYYYGGRLWVSLGRLDSPDSPVRDFLSEMCIAFGMDELKVYTHRFRKEIYLQFVDSLRTQFEVNLSVDVVYFRNVVLEMDRGVHRLRDFRKSDFQLVDVGYDYDESAVCGKWDAFLDEMLPCRESQCTLHEFMYYIFVRNQFKWLKLEKCLMLLGSGNNGKSVVMEVISALVGRGNICSYSVPDLTSKDADGRYARASFAESMLNYSSEVGTGRGVDYDMFKQLVSQEPFNARHPHGRSFTATRCGKMMYNGNKKPSAEPTVGFFRRLLLLPFEVEVEEGKEDIDLAQKIIDSDIAGIMNRVLRAGLGLVKRKSFTLSEGHKRLMLEWKVEKDNLSAFLEDVGYRRSGDRRVPAKDVFDKYKQWADDQDYKSRYIISTNVQFYARLRALGYKFHPKNVNGVKMVYMDTGGDGELSGIQTEVFGGGSAAVSNPFLDSNKGSTDEIPF